MVITSVLILGMSAAYRQARLLWSVAEDNSAICHQGRILTEILRQELSGLYFPSKPDNNNQTRFKLTRDSLSFYTLTPAFKRAPQSSRIAKVRYSFSRNDENKTLTIERSEQPCSGDRIIGTERSNVILPGPADLQIFAATDGSDYSDEAWKSSYNAKDNPPAALKLLMQWPQKTHTEPISFQTTIIIPCRGQLYADGPLPRYPQVPF